MRQRDDTLGAIPPWRAPDASCCNRRIGGIKHASYGHKFSSLGRQECMYKKLIYIVAIDAPV
jgi:hypothetical protein